MAGRINTYTLLRKIHLYAGFALMAFLLMYFITGYILTHEGMFPNQDPVETTEELEVEIPDNISIDDLPVYIQEKFSLKGQRKKPNIWKTGEIAIKYIRPGYINDVVLSADKSTLSIKRQKLSTRRTLILFHRLEKYGGGLLYDLYILMMDLSSVALILFAASGVYMWLKLEKNKIWGVLFLSAGIIYTLVVVLSIMNG
ncbi:MAG: PepSY-associated TM helix domain-containing protein [Cyclobacteriaceae bacterium]|nr:PepSY-associated TM helix domain-containing protein [Cyclobacteriaceae bacterium]